MLHSSNINLKSTQTQFSLSFCSKLKNESGWAGIGSLVEKWAHCSFSFGPPPPDSVRASAEPKPRGGGVPCRAVGCLASEFRRAGIGRIPQSHPSPWQRRLLLRPPPRRARSPSTDSAAPWMHHRHRRPLGMRAMCSLPLSSFPFPQQSGWGRGCALRATARETEKQRERGN